jgi:hypothetical protein
VSDRCGEGVPTCSQLGTRATWRQRGRRHPPSVIQTVTKCFDQKTRSPLHLRPATHSLHRTKELPDEQAARTARRSLHAPRWSSLHQGSQPRRHSYLPTGRTRILCTAVTPQPTNSTCPPSTYRADHVADQSPLSSFARDLRWLLSLFDR